MLPVVGASSNSASMASASKASASRAKLGFTPSSQNVSELTRKNGASPSSGNALAMPPPVPSNFAALVGDHDARLFARRQMPLQRVSEIMHVDHGALDAGFGQAVERVIDQRLAADLHQRLRHVAVVGPHARAKTGRQHDRVSRHHPTAPAETHCSIRAIITHPGRARCCRTKPSAAQASDAPARAANSATRGECGAGIAVYHRAGRAERRCRESWSRAAPPSVA